MPLWARLWIATPTCIVMVWLYLSAYYNTCESIHVPDMVFWPIGPVALLTAVLFSLILGIVFRANRSTIRALVMLSPCYAAPFGLLQPWTAAPGLGGIYFGGYRFFLGWLVKYPNFGPINYEVLLGILCVMGSVILPAIYAFYLSCTRQPRKWFAWGLLLWVLVCYIPMFVQLDLALISFGLSFGWLSMPVYGPLTHAIALLTMAATLLSGCYRTLHQTGDDSAGEIERQFS